MDPIELWNRLGWPLIRLSLAISVGLMIGNLIEALNWTRAMARVAQPLVRLARLSDISGASFSMAFFSGIAANTMLAEAYETGRISRRELILSNLFNALPTNFVHMPSLFFLTLPYLGASAVVYNGLSIGGALLRTAFIVALGHMIMPPMEEGCVVCRLDEQKSANWREALAKSWTRFKKRIRRVLMITTPIYIAVYYMNAHGFFKAVERFMADHVSFLSWLPPKAMSIIVFQIVAESSAGLAAAGALMEAGSLAPRDIVLALLVGNILSSPMRAFRHQFPYYAGIYRPALAVNLIVFNQSLRALSMVVVTVAYALATH